MTDANWIFDRAIFLMDEQNENGGQTHTQDTQAYRDRTLGILNVLRNEVYPYSDTFALGCGGKRSICPEIQSFEQILDIDDAIAQTVLPYGLATHLLLGENDTLASFFNDRYQELLRTIGCRRPVVWEDIPSMYQGGVGL